MVPDEIDVDFLRIFMDFVKEKVAAGEKFILITGGGRICRRYQKSAKDLGVSSVSDNDWVGIYATRFNGEFLRILFGDLAYGELITDPSKIPETEKPVIVASGWKPGWSTDYDAVFMAETVKIKKIVNMTNVDYVYDKDPKQFPDAKKIETVSWGEYRKLIPEKWGPGLNTPFDPIASRKAEELGLEVAILNGKNMNNVRKYFDGEDFIGTVIK